VIHRQDSKSPAGTVDSRIGYCGHRISRTDAGVCKQFSRNVESADRRVFVQIPQDIRQLQCVTETLSKLSAPVFLHSEDAGGETTDRTSHPIAIDAEHCEVGSADISGHIHVHAVDHRKEVRLA
jgi:hypothetical protein